MCSTLTFKICCRACSLLGKWSKCPFHEWTWNKSHHFTYVEASLRSIFVWFLFPTSFSHCLILVTFNQPLTDVFYSFNTSWSRKNGSAFIYCWGCVCFFCFFFCLQGFQFHHNMLVIDCNLGIGSINCWGLMCVINAMGDISIRCQKILSSSCV